MDRPDSVREPKTPLSSPSDAVADRDLPESDPDNTPDPSVITNLATAYWASVVLFTTNRMGVFDLLGAGPRSAEQLAASCDAHPRSMSMLLNAAVGQGLLSKNGGGYSNTPLSGRFLCKESPHYLGDAMRYSEDLYSAWGSLADAVRANEPPVSPSAILGADPVKTRNFVMGMHNRALGVAKSLATTLDLSGRQRMFDVGGGPGTYSILLVGKTPSLRATVLDLPPIIEIGKQIIAGSGLSDRIEAIGDDYTTRDFRGTDGERNDVVLMSGMLHRETPEVCRQLVRKAYDALVPGGLVVASDVFFENEAKDSPRFATLFALTVFLSTRNGSSHSRTEVEHWMKEAGFVDLEMRPLPPPVPYTMLIGVKP